MYWIYPWIKFKNKNLFDITKWFSFFCNLEFKMNTRLKPSFISVGWVALSIRYAFHQTIALIRYQLGRFLTYEYKSELIHRWWELLVPNSQRLIQVSILKTNRCIIIMALKEGSYLSRTCTHSFTSPVIK